MIRLDAQAPVATPLDISSCHEPCHGRSRVVVRTTVRGTRCLRCRSSSARLLGAVQIDRQERTESARGRPRISPAPGSPVGGLPGLPYVEVVEIRRSVAELGQPACVLADLHPVRVLHRDLVRVELNDAEVEPVPVPVGRRAEWAAAMSTTPRWWPATRCWPSSAARSAAWISARSARSASIPLRSCSTGRCRSPWLRSWWAPEGSGHRQHALLGLDLPVVNVDD